MVVACNVLFWLCLSVDGYDDNDGDYVLVMQSTLRLQ